MGRTLLVDHVKYGGVPLPWSATVLMTVHRDDPEGTDWGASIALPGEVELPERGEFTGSLGSGRVAGQAILVRSEITNDEHGERTLVVWQGTGALALPG